MFIVTDTTGLVPAPFAAVRLNVDMPALVGMPLNVPVEALRVNPGGTMGLLQISGSDPVAVNI